MADQIALVDLELTNWVKGECVTQLLRVPSVELKLEYEGRTLIEDEDYELIRVPPRPRVVWKLDGEPTSPVKVTAAIPTAPGRVRTWTDSVKDAAAFLGVVAVTCTPFGGCTVSTWKAELSAYDDAAKALTAGSDCATRTTNRAECIEKVATAWKRSAALTEEYQGRREFAEAKLASLEEDLALTRAQQRYPCDPGESPLMCLKAVATQRAALVTGVIECGSNEDRESCAVRLVDEANARANQKLSRQ